MHIQHAKDYQNDKPNYYCQVTHTKPLLFIILCKRVGAACFVVPRSHLDAGEGEDNAEAQIMKCRPLLDIVVSLLTIDRAMPSPLNCEMRGGY